ncbi:MAG: hypothetical protein HYU67_06430 [Flavobacteriia bacterium]|nr:hypothetical protein [Flavobacteriia bacterium]
MKYLKSLFLLAFIIQISSILLYSQEEKFYLTIQNEEKASLEAGLKEINLYKKNANIQIYIGAIEAKLAQFEKNPQQKISSFKKGIEQIESAIKKEPNNVEFRFIRFMIQEKAPKILRYQSNLEEDKKMIEKNYTSCSQIVKKNITKYTSENKSLQLR